MKFYVFKRNLENEYKKEDAVIMIGVPDVTYNDNNKPMRCPQPEFLITEPENYIVISQDDFNMIKVTKEDADALASKNFPLYADLNNHIKYKYNKNN